MYEILNTILYNKESSELSWDWFEWKGAWFDRKGAWFDWKGSWFDWKGAWSAPVIYCPKQRPPLHGSAMAEDNTFGALREFFCHHGYHLVGAKFSYCTADGVWTSPVPECHGKFMFCSLISSVLSDIAGSWCNKTVGCVTLPKLCHTAVLYWWSWRDQNCMLIVSNVWASLLVAHTHSRFYCEFFFTLILPPSPPSYTSSYPLNAYHSIEMCPKMAGGVNYSDSLSVFLSSVHMDHIQQQYSGRVFPANDS